MSRDDFAAASHAAETWLNTVGLVAYLGQMNSVDEAYKLLLPTPDSPNRPNLSRSFDQHAATLRSSFPQLAAISDGSVKWEHGRGVSAVARIPEHVYPHVWSSAHEAAHGIAELTIDLLVAPLEGITDPAEQRRVAGRVLKERGKAVAMSMDEVATLQERIRRERAKVSMDIPLPNSSASATWLGNGRVQVGDEIISLEPQLAEVLQALVELQSATKPQLQKHSGRDEPDKLLKRLVERFPSLKPHIRFPGGRGRGGYRTTIGRSDAK